MANTFLISDTHFGHKGICKFLREDGTKLRPWDDTDEMDEILVQNWNSVVKPNDIVYHVGDVVMNRRCLPTVGRLAGRKILIKGNHDVFPLVDFTPYFEDVRGSTTFSDMILTHIPIHSASVGRFTVNVHGHMHDRFIPSDVDPTIPDPSYFNVSVEQINYTPISLDDLRKAVADRKAQYLERAYDKNNC
jgi:calcineurin-like phosphoesterase family protein